MADWAGFIWQVATCLFGCTKAHAAYVYKLKQNVVSLEQNRRDLEIKKNDVKRKIQIAETKGKVRTDEVKGWLEDVLKLEKEIEDIPEIQEVHNDKCVSGYCPKNCVLNYNLGKKVVEILAKAEKPVTKAGNIEIVDEQLPKAVVAMPHHDLETVGLDRMVDKIWNSIIKDESVGTIGLYGMGGAGKTTLMKRIHNEFANRKHGFDLVLWVEVSSDCDINEITNDIRKRLGIDDNFWNSSRQVPRLAKIFDLLKQKKFVLMLDDLWEKLELEKVGVPYPKDTNHKSKVLFTTRSEDVCAKMQADEKIKVECLQWEEAFDLFCKKVTDKTLKCHTKIPKLAEEMAKECKGLPLALVTVGSSMSGVEGIDSWTQTKKDLRSSYWTAGELKDKVFSSLKRSYDKLPDETLKSCFRYCALYPKDCEIDTDDLIDRWIGEGFLGKHSKQYDMLEQGKSIIEQLKDSSLIEGTNYYPNWGSGIKMHNVIRDMALWLARDENKNKDKVLVQG